MVFIHAFGGLGLVNETLEIEYSGYNDVKQKQLRFVITGAFLYGNLGSAAMVVVLTRQLLALFPNSVVTLASKYPDKDKLELNKYLDIIDLRVASARQLRATFLLLPLSMLYKLLRYFGIRSKVIEKQRELKIFADADYVFDIGGITFSKERGLSGLIINITWVLIPYSLGIPIVKVAQAFGPIEKGWFENISQKVLNYVNLIISRGYLSSAELDKLKLIRDYKQCSDIAFLLDPVRPLHDDQFTRKIPTINITPSSVLYQKIGAVKYINLFRKLIEDIALNYPEYSIRLIAHSFKQGKTLNNNDYPVCKEIWDSLPEQLRDKTSLVFGDYTASEMKYILGQSDLLIACRFHSMVGALGMGVPVFVLGWSHKYKEIMDFFGLDTVLNYKDLSYEKMWKLVNKAIKNKEKNRAKVNEKIGDCIESAMNNFVLIEEFVTRNEYSKDCSVCSR